MKRFVYKYPLALAAHQRLPLPVGAQVLAVQMQYNTPMLWAIVNPQGPFEFFDVLIEGTGQEHNELYSRHLGTVQHDGMVWHFFTRP